MTFATLSSFFAKLEGITSRLAITEVLADLFSSASSTEITILCYLSLGRLAPLYEPLEFQLAEKMIIRVIGQAFNVSEDRVRETYKEVGDLGEVAEKLKVKSEKLKVIATTRSSKLSMLEVYGRLRKIAEENGEGSQQRKIEGLVLLLHELDSVSCKYVVRMVLGRLRLGFSDVTILDALSWMKTGTKTLRPRLEQAYFVRADIGAIAALFKKKGVSGLSGIAAKLGVPVMPALCQRLKSPQEMIAKMGRVAVEPKYDGQRVQIHWAKRKGQSAKGKAKGVFLRAFTRNLEEVSFMFPELGRITADLSAREVILDSEAVSYDTSSGKILPFQEIITRKRKHAILEAAAKVPLRFFVFDILYKDGRSLLHLPLSNRAALLEQTLAGGKVLMKTERIVTEDPNVLRQFHAKQLTAGLEGAVVKKWNAPYSPGRRGWSWVKYKEAEERTAGLSDTLDCVVMGYYRGRGKRASFGIGGFFVWIPKGGHFCTISKIGTGLSDEQWKELRLRADRLAVSDKPKEYGDIGKTLAPDIWTRPSLVVEIAADNITRSPVHSAGLALRFPRLVRFRDDKGPGQATTMAEVSTLYQLQGK